MTALKDYIRLESTGLWRADEAAQRRDVYVFVGTASLVIADKTEAPLSHWSLPAIERRNPGVRPALFAPGPDEDETLEIEDTDMIEAIERVQRAVKRAEPRPGRLRLLSAAGAALLVLAAGAFWLPDAIKDHATSVVPVAQRAAIGAQALGALEQMTGPACTTPEGRRVLAQLTRRVASPDAPRVHVVRSGVETSLLLPGPLVVLGRSVIEDHETADVAAGALLSELARAELHDPLRDMLDVMGTTTTLRFLTTGKLPDRALQAYARHALRTPPEAIPEAALLDRFARARVATTPYARALDVTGETTLGLIEADPYRDAASPVVLDDNAWVVLQALCEG
ncbi:hypothetical protein PVW48_17000 [Dinoroseobacter sp. PD6]|uniref:hypothetical protein n=1 Tax=Dinoroseobacter sp. PD6 TaxID=3028384 RepID=UPI00237B91C7|nr:hypothetical protein [Dinoroseobacter sp. PD6]MDD9718463.1 hypothetical protein [Dinoroseobacter sp. PD6]